MSGRNTVEEEKSHSEFYFPMDLLIKRRFYWWFVYFWNVEVTHSLVMYWTSVCQSSVFTKNRALLVQDVWLHSFHLSASLHCSGKWGVGLCLYGNTLTQTDTHTHAHNWLVVKLDQVIICVMWQQCTIVNLSLLSLCLKICGVRP